MFQQMIHYTLSGSDMVIRIIIVDLLFLLFPLLATSQAFRAKSLCLLLSGLRPPLPFVDYGRHFLMKCQVVNGEGGHAGVVGELGHCLPQWV
jgi:hypothetical protein